LYIPPGVFSLEQDLSGRVKCAEQESKFLGKAAVHCQVDEIAATSDTLVIVH
jgi:hypothetical protein